MYTEGNWWLLNDSKRRRATLQQVLAEEAYMLCYVRNQPEQTPLTIPMMCDAKQGDPRGDAHHYDADVPKDEICKHALYA